MDRHRTRTGGLPRIALSAAAAAVLAAGGCEQPGPEPLEPPQEPGPDVQPDPELGAQAPDIDIGARSTEETRAAQNRAAAERAGNGAGDEPAGGGAAADGAGGAAGGADAEIDQLAALETSQIRAHAVLEPTSGNEAHGDASFIQTDEGLEIVVTMARLTPGQHGIHIHQNGDCSGPKAEAAGDHFNPDDTPHGPPSADPTTRHAGDLGNISADSQGEADLNITMPDLLLQGARGVVGKAIVVHDSEDDFESQPSGESGDPVACGVIEARGTA